MVWRTPPIKELKIYFDNTYDMLCIYPIVHKLARFKNLDAAILLNIVTKSFLKKKSKGR